MKYLFIVLFGGCIFVSADLCKKRMKYNVTIEVTFTQSYCGGARPTDEMMRELNTPKPISGKKIFIRKGKENNVKEKIVTEGITDDFGKLNVKLEPGFYCVVDENKKNRAKVEEWMKQHEKPTQNYEAIDKDCLEKWLKTPDLIIEVKPSENLYTINYHQPCSWKSVPCAKYIGPLPK